MSDRWMSHRLVTAFEDVLTITGTARGTFFQMIRFLQYIRSSTEWRVVLQKRHSSCRHKRESWNWTNHSSKVQLVFKPASKHDSDQGISRFFPEAQNIDYYHSIVLILKSWVRTSKLKIRVERYECEIFRNYSAHARSSLLSGIPFGKYRKYIHVGSDTFSHYQE